MFAVTCLFVVFLVSIIQPITSKTEKPNIIFMVADDLGWNDVGFHGCNQLRTSNIDALAYHGLILNRHYVLPTCTPSRASLMTGKYAIKTGLQGDPSTAMSPFALPIGEKILPQYLKDLGYKTHLVGKWHLGYSEKKFTPTQRGFDTHFGYYNGWVRYNDSVTTTHSFSGIDARRNLEPAGKEVAGKYLTEVYTKEAVQIIKNHDHRRPLFLDISHVAVHATKNYPNNLHVPDKAENDRKFHYIKDEYRRLYAGMLDSMDQSVGKVIAALHESKLLENSIVIFMADNGGPTIDPIDGFINTASNWPLRGMKSSFFEGAVRGAAAIWSPLLKHRHVITNELFHISDWLPTLVNAAGGTIDSSSLNLDGVSQWSYLTGQQPKSDRHEVLVNIDHEKGLYGIISKKWKLIHCNATYNPSFADHYDGIPARNDSEIPYNMHLVLESPANLVLSQYSAPVVNSSQLFDQIRQSDNIEESCKKRINAGLAPPAEMCKANLLYNLERDPCEFDNIEAHAPSIIKYLRARLDHFESETMPLQRYPDDSKADPSRFGGYWTWWLDFPDPNGVAVVSSGLAILVAVVLYKIR